MIKGLYFKLNTRNPRHEEIHRFFIDETENLGIDKIRLLQLLIRLYKVQKVLEDNKND
ncbi:MAG: hypothetical protein J6Y78_08115 [Paludibacteraceae bacterium]|nr:hypothetical protein [Paludibacteraceae bacterium]